MTTLRERISFMKQIGFSYNFRTKEFNPYRSLKGKILLDNPTPKRELSKRDASKINQYMKQSIRMRNQEDTTADVVKEFKKFISNKEAKYFTVPAKDKHLFIKQIAPLMDKDIMIQIGKYIYSKLSFSETILRLLRSLETDYTPDVTLLEFLANLQEGDIKMFRMGLKKVKRKLKEEGFFPYLLKPEYAWMNLERFGIYSEFDAKNYRHNCVYQTLLRLGFEEDDLLSNVHLFNRGYITNKALKGLADNLGIRIKIHFPKGGEKNEMGYKYVGSGEDMIKVVSMQNHMFTFEDVEFTSYSMEHYDVIKDEKDFHKIVGKKTAKYYERKSSRFLNSYQVVKLLLSNPDKYLIELHESDEIYKTQYYKDDEDVEFKNLNYNSEDYTKETVNSNDEYWEDWSTNELNKLFKNHPNEPLIVYYDFESYKDIKTNQPKDYLCACCINGVVRGFTTGLNLLFSITNQVNQGDTIYMYAHNAGFDYQFITEHLYHEEPVFKDGRLISVTAMFNHRKLILRCTQNFINKKLADMPACFKIETEKEVMPYKLYDDYYKNGAKDWNFRVPLEICLRYIDNKEDKERFIQNCNKFKCIDKEGVNIKRYSMEYCKIDCLVLYKCFEKFRSYLTEFTHLYTEDYMTISAVAQQYTILNKCYDDVYAIAGKARAFIQKCVVGGRCMTANNEIQIPKINTDDLEDRINVYDVNSLYPSAMIRMDGVPKGIPKVITPETNLKDVSCYYVRVKVLSIEKRLNFPLQSVKVNGIRNFTNDLIGKEIYIDNISLDDFIEHQGVKVEIIQGYYYNDGFNNTINSVIDTLYTERKRFKKAGNPIQEVIKLILNSIYGKSMLAPITERQYFVYDNEELAKQITRNYNQITRPIVQVGTEKYLISKFKPIHNHFNNVQFGVLVLGWSKRIMNEAMVLADDKIFYQDTDSMHMKKKDYDELSLKFESKYGRPIDGNQLGQMHDDFPSINGLPASAIDSAYLAKKVYFDTTVNVNGDVSVVCKMKGVSNDSILHSSKKYKLSIPEIYKELSIKGNYKKFDLSCEGTKMCLGRVGGDFTSYQYRSKGLIRELNFTDSKEEKAIHKKK